MISMFVAGSATCLLTSPKMNISSIEIKGVKLADQTAIEKAAKPLIGRNIITIKKSTALRSIAQLSEVRQVKIGRRYPDKLWLRVWERKTCAVVVCTNGCYLLQSDGLVFHHTKTAPQGAPKIMLSGKLQMKVGQPTTSVPIRSALKIVEIASEQQTQLHKIIIDPVGDICLNMDSDFCVKLGQPDDIALKMSLLRHALLERPSIIREGEYIDLSCPSAPVWKRKVTSLTAS
jgi:cell division septal protein FtsQ